MVEDILGRVHFTNQSELMLSWGQDSKMKFTFQEIRKQLYDGTMGESTAYGFYAETVNGELREILRFHPDGEYFQIFLDPSTNMADRNYKGQYTEVRVEISEATARELVNHENLQDIPVEDTR